jgi:hypothetical protein
VEIASLLGLGSENQKREADSKKSFHKIGVLKMELLKTNNTII